MGNTVSTMISLVSCIRPTYNFLKSQGKDIQMGMLVALSLPKHHNHSTKQRIYAIQMMQAYDDIVEDHLHLLDNHPKDKNVDLSSAAFIEVYYNNYKNITYKLVCYCNTTFLSAIHKNSSLTIGDYFIHYQCKKAGGASPSKRLPVGDTTRVLRLDPGEYPGAKVSKDFETTKNCLVQRGLIDSSGQYCYDLLINPFVNGYDNIYKIKSDCECSATLFSANENCKKKAKVKSPLQRYVECINILRKNAISSGQIGQWNGYITFCANLGSGAFGKASIIYAQNEPTLGTGFFAFKAMPRDSKNLIIMGSEAFVLKQCENCPYIINIAMDGVYGTPEFVGCFLELGDNKIMQYRQWIDGNGGAVNKSAKQMLNAGGSALVAMNGLGYSHGDVKISNMIIGSDNNFKMIDMGGVVNIGSAMGTVTFSYCPPEYLLKRSMGRQNEYKADPTFDSWSLGVTVYQFITGKKVINYEKSDDKAKRCAAILTEWYKEVYKFTKPNPPNEVSDKMDDELWSMLQNLIVLHPSLRMTPDDIMTQPCSSLERILNTNNNELPTQTYYRQQNIMSRVNVRPQKITSINNPYL